MATLYVATNPYVIRIVVDSNTSFYFARLKKNYIAIAAIAGLLL